MSRAPKAQATSSGVLLAGGIVANSYFHQYVSVHNAIPSELFAVKTSSDFDSEDTMFDYLSGNGKLPHSSACASFDHFYPSLVVVL